MSKLSKTKKLVTTTSDELLSVVNVETQVEPTVEIIQEISSIVEDAVVAPIAAVEIIPEVIAATVTAEEKIEPVVEPVVVESPVEKVEESTPVVQSVPTRKVGKFVVGERYLTSNPTFFTWLHKQGYSIIERTPLRNGNINFVVEGGTLDAVSGDIPEYLLFIGNHLSLKRK